VLFQDDIAGRSVMVVPVKWSALPGVWTRLVQMICNFVLLRQNPA